MVANGFVREQNSRTHRALPQRVKSAIHRSLPISNSPRFGVFRLTHREAEPEPTIDQVNAALGICEAFFSSRGFGINETTMASVLKSFGSVGRSASLYLQPVDRLTDCYSRWFC